MGGKGNTHVVELLVAREDDAVVWLSISRAAVTNVDNRCSAAAISHSSNVDRRKKRKNKTKDLVKKKNFYFLAVIP